MNLLIVRAIHQVSAKAWVNFVRPKEVIEDVRRRVT
jgi:hypothetical protein